MVFHYLDVFGKEEDQATIQEMKDHYHGVVQEMLKPNAICQRFLKESWDLFANDGFEFAKDMGQVYDMLQKGSEVARSVAAETLDQVKSAMGLNYFK